MTTIQSEPNSAILTRIAKLLQMQEARGCTEAEATLAAEKVQELLQEHNLTLSQVEAAGGNTSDDSTSKRAKKNTGRRAMYEWQRNLMQAVAASNFCLHRVSNVLEKAGTIRHNGKLHREDSVSRHHQLVGRVVNVQASLALYDYLVEAMERHASQADVRGNRREETFFKEGATSRLAYRLMERRRQREARPSQANGTGRELVTLSEVYGSEDDLNNDHLNNFTPGTTASRRRETEERRKRQEAEHDRLVAEGVDNVEAWYLAYGYGPERAAELATTYRRRANRRGGRGRRQTWTSEDRRNFQRESSRAYQAGRKAGDSIGLDAQVSPTSRPRLPKSGG